MTRETKVGLLVGICVILLIGIIISDQLTVMQQPAPAQFTDAAATAQETLTPLPLSDPSQASMPLTPPPAVREAVVPLPQDLTPPPPQVQTVEQPQAPAQPSDRTTFVDVASNRPVVPDPNGQFHAVNPVSPPNVTLSATDRAGSLTPPGTSPVAAADTLRRQPAPLYHDVATGETLYQIAQRYYGNGETWKIIREANMDKVDAKGNVKLGVRLTIPNKASLVETTTTRTTTITRMPASGGSTVIGAQAPIAADNSGTALRIVQAPAPARTVTVEKGQTLGTLARIHLGSSAKWPDLLAANRDQLKNPQDLKPGMKLRLPGSAAPSPAAAAPAPAPGMMAQTPPPATPATLTGPSPATPTPGNAGLSPNAMASSAGTKAYTVVSGDSLYSIAAKTLGDGTQYHKIFEANRDQLKDPDDISEGMVLKVPR